MKKAFLTGSTILSMALVANAAEDLTTQLALQTDCKAVSQIVSSAFAGKVDDAAVAGVLEIALKAKAGCACEIVTAAIVSTGASAKEKASTIEVIVETAVRAVPEKAATIAECAVAAAPNHAALIDKTLTRVFEDSDEEFLGETGKQTYDKGVEVVDTGISEEEWGWGVRLPAPIYLLAPSGGIIGDGNILVPPISPADPVTDIE